MFPITHRQHLTLQFPELSSWHCVEGPEAALRYLQKQKLVASSTNVKAETFGPVLISKVEEPLLSVPVPSAVIVPVSRTVPLLPVVVLSGDTCRLLAKQSGSGCLA